MFREEVKNNARLNNKYKGKYRIIAARAVRLMNKDELHKFLVNPLYTKRIIWIC